MAKAKKRVAPRKKNAKRGKVRAKHARKKAAKRAWPKKQPPKAMAPRKTLREGVPVVEDTIIDVIDEPIPRVVRVTEYETIKTATTKPGAGPETEE